MFGIVEDVYALLGTQPHMLLGRWLDAARAWGQSPAEKAMMEFNARNQLTLWGPRGEIADYASKQWSGLMRDYYLRRWQMFFARVGAALRDGADLDQHSFLQELLVFEQAWQRQAGDSDGQPFAAEAQGDAAKLVVQLEGKYKQHIINSLKVDIYDRQLPRDRLVRAPGWELGTPSALGIAL